MMADAGEAGQISFGSAGTATHQREICPETLRSAVISTACTSDGNLITERIASFEAVQQGVLAPRQHSMAPPFGG
jgi:hypothetical protein